MITDPGHVQQFRRYGASLWHVCLDSIRAAEWATRRQDQLAPPVCTENSNPDVMMVKPGEDRCERMIPVCWIGRKIGASLCNDRCVLTEL